MAGAGNPFAFVAGPGTFDVVDSWHALHSTRATGEAIAQAPRR